MAQLGFRTANRRYKFLFWPMMAVYVMVVLATAVLIDKDTAALWVKAACSVAVTLPLFGVLYAMRRQTEETDEYTRMKQLKSMRDGGLITAGIAFLVGFLQIFDAVSSVDIFWFGALFFFAYGLSNLTNCFGRVV